jgi:hypothetical protein
LFRALRGGGSHTRCLIVLYSNTHGTLYHSGYTSTLDIASHEVQPPAIFTNVNNHLFTFGSIPAITKSLMDYRYRFLQNDHYAKAHASRFRNRQ